MYSAYDLQTKYHIRNHSAMNHSQVKTMEQRDDGPLKM